VTDAAAAAAARDAADELAPFRDRFYRRPGQIYLDGNSLGLLSDAAERALLRALEQWKVHAIEGWTEGEAPWFFLAEELGRQTAPLVGAAPDRVIVTGSTTGNLHQLLATLYDPDDGRPGLLADALAFPSDIHALTSHLRLRGLDPAEHLIRVPSRNGWTLDENEIITAMDAHAGRVQIAVLPSVVYTSGQLLDMARVTRKRGRVASGSAGTARTRLAPCRTGSTIGARTSRSGAPTSTCRPGRARSAACT
jgi:kynureninase